MVTGEKKKANRKKMDQTSQFFITVKSKCQRIAIIKKFHTEI